MFKTKKQGKGIVKALHQKGTTGNFKKIEKAKGKGAAIGALQNKLAKVRGEKVPFGGKKKRPASDLYPKQEEPMGYRKAKSKKSTKKRGFIGGQPASKYAAPTAAGSIYGANGKGMYVKTSTPSTMKGTARRVVPQRKNHRSMTGKEMLGKGMKKLAGR